MNRSRIINLALIFVLIFAVLIAATQLMSVSRQVSTDAASTTDFSDEPINFLGLVEVPQTSLFVALTLFTLASLAVIGVGLTLLFRFLNQEVAEARVEADRPVNPLSYDTYGHLAGIGIFIVLFALTAFFLLGTNILPTQASVEAQKVDRLFRIEFFFIAFFFALVTGALIHFLIYFRARPGDTSDGAFSHGNTRLELAWTIGPAILVTVLGIIAGIYLSDISEAKAGEVPIKVVGRQWGWSFEYPGDVIPEHLRPEEDLESFTSSELVLLVDQPVLFEMTSVDVIHAFWIPELRVKRDLAPGVETELRLTPNLAGDYEMLCNQLCGTGHWIMRAPVRVVDQAGYELWIEETLAAMGNPVLAGENLANQSGCLGCHAIDGSRLVGPTWLNLYGSEREFEDGSTTIADHDYIYNSITNPGGQVVAGYPDGVMPQNYSEQLSDVQIDQIIHYIMSLSEQGRQELEAEGLLPDEMAGGEMTDESMTTDDSATGE